MKRRQGERIQDQETHEDVHSSPPKKAKKKKRRLETEEREEELQCRVSDDGAEQELQGKKKAKKKKKKCERETECDTVGETEGAQISDKDCSSMGSGRKHTVSMALPGSIMDNAQTLELKTYLAGQIARAAVIFSVDEIIIFNEQGKPGSAVQGSNSSDPNVFLARLLEYQETPQYLRKALFPMHRDLKYAGLLNPLDCPHHMRADDLCPYREGIVTGQSGSGEGSSVDCGMKNNVVIDRELEVGTRVTVRLESKSLRKKGGRGGGGERVLRGEAVAPSVPRREAGLYWGYTVRLADSFSSVFTDSPHQGGYDLTIGTSERGESVDSLSSLPQFQHLLVVFGGVKGLEHALGCDDTLTVGDVSLLFHHYLNTCPNQGSRTIRTECSHMNSLSATRFRDKRSLLSILSCNCQRFVE